METGSYGAGMNVLVLNCGSSSVKFQLLHTDPDLIETDEDRRLARGQIERLGGIDAEANDRCRDGVLGTISPEGAHPGIHVIPTNEELLIARDTVREVERLAAHES